MEKYPYHFQGQHDQEEILEIVHRHWFNILSHFFIVVLMAVAILGSFFIFPALFPELIDPKLARFFLFLQNTFFLFIWLYGFLLWIDYYFDVWIVTGERIVNIEQKGLFSRDVSELHFGRVQDVTCEVTGLIPTMLNYGDVLIQTAGAEERFVFRQVPDPYRLKDLIMRKVSDAADADRAKLATSIKSAATPA